MRRLLALSLIAWPLTGCDNTSANCDDAMAEGVGPAVEACPSMADFIAAAEKHPDTLNGADPYVAVKDYCAGRANTYICGEAATAPGH